MYDVCYVPSIGLCVRYKTLYIIGGQHDGLCPFWPPARSIFTVLLCHVCFSRANKLSLSLVLLHLHIILLTVDMRSLDNIRRFVQFGPSDSIPAFSGSDVWFFVSESCRVENERPSE